MPVPAFVTTPVVAFAVIVLATELGDALGEAARIVAATPATNGADIEVPSRTSVAVFDDGQAETIPTPGAKTSMHVP